MYLACHLQIDADPVPDPAYHIDADPDSDFNLMRNRIFYLKRIRMRIQVTKMMWIRIHKTAGRLAGSPVSVSLVLCLLWVSAVLRILIQIPDP
jgi:hypothetical protein